MRVHADGFTSRIVNHRAAGVTAFGISLVFHRRAGRTDIRSGVGLLRLIAGRIIRINAETGDANGRRRQALFQSERSRLRLCRQQAGHGIGKHLKNTPIIANTAIDKLPARGIDRILILRRRIVKRAVRIRRRHVELQNLIRAARAMAGGDVQIV